MKRINNLYERICSVENLQLADAIAQQNKGKQYGVIRHNRNAEANILQLHDMLVAKTFTTSEYSTFKVYEPKEREVFRLPYFPDRIVHHAIMNVIEPHLFSTFTADTYACIKGRGVHKAADVIEDWIRDEESTKYYLKIDIRKFYPSVDHAILKQQLRRKFKDNDLLWLLDDIIDSAPGLPIGNFLSQSLSNFNLMGFDHWIKQDMKVKRYLRYVDDMVIFHSEKPYLHQMRKAIQQYLQDNLKLELKSNYRVVPFDKCGLDMLGYHFWRGYTLMRKRNKKNFARAVASGASRASLAGHIGWAKHCNSKHLLKKLLPNE